MGSRPTDGGGCGFQTPHPTAFGIHLPLKGKALDGRRLLRGGTIPPPHIRSAPPFAREALGRVGRFAAGASPRHTGGAVGTAGASPRPTGGAAFTACRGRRALWGSKCCGGVRRNGQNRSLRDRGHCWRAEVVAAYGWGGFGGIKNTGAHYMPRNFNLLI